MKRILLSMAAAVAVAGGAGAAVEPSLVPDCLVSMTSRNGVWGVSDDSYGTVVLYNAVTREEVRFTPQMQELPSGDLLVTSSYSIGAGNCVSDNGLLLAHTTEAADGASYYENGTWRNLPLPTGMRGGASASGVTPTGHRICGMVWGNDGADGVSVMSRPVVWTRDQYGMYTSCKELPYPETDFTGRTPQAIRTIAISDDGRMIAGQVWDYYGIAPEPVIFQEKEDGTWYYWFPETDYHDPSYVWPENPGEPPVTPMAEDFLTGTELEEYLQAVEEYENRPMVPEPDVQQYMTAEEWAAYSAAYNAWDPSLAPFPPSATDFMTEEEKAAYQQALADWQKSQMPYPEAINYLNDEQLQAYAQAMYNYTLAYADWNSVHQAIQDLYFDILDNCPRYDWNNVLLSGNGKWLGTTSVKDMMGTPVRFNLETKERQIFEQIDAFVTYVNDEGTLMAGSPLMTTDRDAVIMIEDGVFEPLADYIQSQNEDAADWMWQVGCTTGTPSGANNLSIIWMWNMPEDEIATTYVVPINYDAALNTLESAGAEAKPFYFNLQGQPLQERPDDGGLYLRRCGTKVEKVVI